MIDTPTHKVAVGRRRINRHPRSPLYLRGRLRQGWRATPSCGHTAPLRARRMVGEVPEKVQRQQGWTWWQREVGASQRWSAPSSRDSFPTVYNTSCFSLSLSFLSPSSLSLLPSHSLLLSPTYVLGLPVVPAGFVSPHWWHTGPKRLPIPGITPPGWVGLGTLLQEAAGTD